MNKIRRKTAFNYWIFFVYAKKFTAFVLPNFRASKFSVAQPSYALTANKKFEPKRTIYSPYFILGFLLCFISTNISAQFCGNASSEDNLTVATSIQQTNSYSNGKRAFIFPAISGNTYVFSTCNTTTGDTKLILYSSATGGTELAVSDNACGANGKQSEISWVCPTDGDYSVFLTKKNCKNLNFAAYLEYYMIIPDPCAGITISLNAGVDISLCQGSSTGLSAIGTTTYPPSNYLHCASSGNMDFATSTTFVSFDGETSFSNTTGKTAAYTDYSASFVADVIAGQTYADALTLRINSDGNRIIAGKAWIDWNRDDQFDASEEYDLGTTTNSADGITTLSPLAISVPVSVTPGYVKMRVSTRWENPSTECETNFDGEVEDYALLITAPLSYSWSPSTELDNPAIENPTCSATTNQTYTVTAANSFGCSEIDDLLAVVEVPSLVTSLETVNDSTTCGIITIDVSTDAVSGSGVWSHTNGLGLFDDPTDAMTQFSTNTFNQSQTLTWTTNSGACSGSTTEITALFHQPETSSISSNLSASTSWLWGGLSSSDYNTSSNWYTWDGSKWLKELTSTPSSNDEIFVLPNATSGLCVSQTNFLTASVDITSLIVESAGTATLSGNISFSGDIVNDGNIDGGSSTLTLNGSTDQTLSGSGIYLLDNLTINKSSSDLILSSPATIQGTLTMTSGNIVNPLNILTVGISSSNPGSLTHTSGIVTGQLRRYLSNGNGATFFPIGNSTTLRDVSIDIQGSPGTNQYLTASFVSGCPQGSSGNLQEGLPLTASDGQLVENYNEEGYWNISPTDNDYNSQINSKTYDIELHMNNFSNMNDFSQMRIIKSPGSNTSSSNHIAWTATTHVTSLGANNDFIVSATSVGFSFFGSGGDNNGALPVELTSFNGECVDDGVQLIWQTESEFNSSHYDIEYSRDGLEWSVIHTQSAAGNSTEDLVYEYTHKNASSGDNYYRLNQIDIDGTVKTYDIINVNCENQIESYFTIYPNPSNESFNIVINDSRILGDALIQITDTKGNVILTKSVEVKSGINMFIMNEDISSGIYYINILSGGKSTRILKHSIL